jgi:hypothetical protein
VLSLLEVDFLGGAPKRPSAPSSIALVTKTRYPARYPAGRLRSHLDAALLPSAAGACRARGCPRSVHELREQSQDLFRGETVPKVANLEPCQPALIIELVNVDAVEALGRTVERAGA